jgi:hypothetical protein
MATLAYMIQIQIYFLLCEEKDESTERASHCLRTQPIELTLTWTCVFISLARSAYLSVFVV